MRRKLRRLSEIDVVDRFAPAPPLIVQAVFGAACSAAAVIARWGVDAISTGAGPYSLIYPAILISTLFGRWQAGLITWATSFLFVWYFVLPNPGGFGFEHDGDFPRTVVNGFSALVIVLFAEIFRHAMRSTMNECDQEVETHELLLREIDHRMRNNFAIVISMLNLQRGRHQNAEVKQALTDASERVHSIASAHQFLYGKRGDNQQVDMRAYLISLADHLKKAIFERDIYMTTDIEVAAMPRDKAIAIGLIVNELVTNAAKHAFDGKEPAEIVISFTSSPEGWRLCVADNGRGLNGEHKGLGMQLIEGFAERAGGRIVIDDARKGARISVVESDAAAEE
ncbi:sensor histidine kinase [Hyphococcus sp.]|uniref:sensor histidine kinase n=1 Tax=Hyphococcus sp. TaxID=2038636 RepID=UPI003CCB8C3A